MEVSTFDLIPISPCHSLLIPMSGVNALCTPTFFPMVTLSEVAQLWGNRRIFLPDNYHLPFPTLLSAEINLQHQRPNTSNDF